MNSQTQTDKQRQRSWRVLLIVLPVIGVLCLAGVLFGQEFVSSQGPEFIPVTLHSLIEADYGSNPDAGSIAGLRLDIIWDVIFDREPNAGNIEARKAALLQSLAQAVPYVSRPACQGVYTIYAAQDTWLDSQNPHQVYGRDLRLHLGGAGDGATRLLLYFPVNDAFEPGVYIQRATLEMEPENPVPPPPTGQLGFFSLTAPFNEITAAWANQPDSGIPYRINPNPPAGKIHAWDVTELVQGWLLDQPANAGLALEPHSTADFTLLYVSREANSQTGGTVGSAGAGSGPRLVIDCGATLAQPQIAAAPPAVTPPPSPSPPPPKSDPDRPKSTVTPAAPPSPVPAAPTPAASTAVPPAPPPTAPAPEPSAEPPAPPTVPTLPPNTPAATPTAPPTVALTATPAPTNTPTPLADLRLTQAVSASPAVAGANLTYTLTVTNAGPSSATNVILVDTLPGSVSLVSATASQGSGCTGADPVTCALGLIPVGGQATVTIVVLVSPTAAGSLTNQAGVSASQSDPVPGNNAASATTAIIAQADVLARKFDSSDPVVAGQGLIYTLVVTNAGPSRAIGTTVSDTLPAEVSFSSTSAGCIQSGGTVTCSAGGLAPGSSRAFTVAVTVLPLVAHGVVITNSAAVSANEPDPASVNNTAVESTTIDRLADISISKTATPDPVIAGQALTYTLTITNAGPSDAAGVVITDTLPGGVVFAAAAGCTENAGVVSCAVGGLGAGATAQRTVVVTVAAGTTGPLANTAAVGSATADPAGGNNSAGATTAVIPIVDLQISKSVDNIAASEGMTLTYSITATNLGPQNATGLVVKDTLPAAINYVQDNSGGAYNSATGAWAIGALANGSRAGLRITGTVKAGTVNTTITNTAAISQLNQVDPVAGNNSASAATVVAPTININNISVTEGNSGTTNAVFTVTLSAVSSRVVTVSYTTADGTATVAGNDYVPISGIVTFVPGVTAQTITVAVKGDTVEEAGTEVFFVTLSNPTNATLLNDQGTGTIVDNDNAVNLMVTCFGASQDVYIHEDAPDHIHSTDNDLKVQPDADKRHHSLIQFDLTPIPAGSTVLTANLFLYEDNKQNNQVIRLHRLTNSWVNAQVTWSHRNIGANIPWTTAGGDYLPAEVANFTPTLDKQYRQVNVTDAAQAWVGGTPNYGLLIRSTGDNGEVTFKSSDEGKVEKRPQLCVEYDAATADLGVTKTVNKATPDQGSNIVYTVTVNNGGPYTATNTVVTDTLPLGVTFAASTTTRGTYTPGTGRWSVGSLSNGGSAVLTLTATVNYGTAGSVITNTATTRADQLDLTSSDNTRAVSIAPVLPNLVINDIAVAEGNSGTRPAVFTVTLSTASNVNVTANYATVNGTATTGSDYAAAAGLVTFLPGVTVRTITVTVNGDTVDEANETFTVNLSEPVNATLADNQGLGTIIDDDISAVSFPPDRDSTIESGNPATNYGADPEIYIDPAGIRGLFRFNLGSIPPASTIVSAVLTVDVSNAQSGQTVSVYRATTNWAEPNVTWNFPWGTPGGDYNATPWGSYNPGSTGPKSIDITGLVQGWVNGTYSNQGVILIAGGAAGTSGVYSKEESNVTLRPRLAVVYNELGGLSVVEPQERPVIYLPLIMKNSLAGGRAPAARSFGAEPAEILPGAAKTEQQLFLPVIVKESVLSP
jgi:uncharacterized repeat protein (TIGR01451 family)